ncbi:endoplasmic reticulum mannosyl-oligosaccharide 1,2-alpha-mannosidase [Podospora aff. communis PSN243]|uniref:alpha-1,2-Mannosidase n=1 Tax=Podospora aff. communis PSN243 TaxID=3040156 RepID=A0AAV9GZC5_9PEZI|nr:endoplasmic reticulum mannosyl-oligosaccharide 1,2-alpha-mannosidase [Podospora aff. communis PSN243]
MVLWKRGPGSRRVSLLFWSAVIVFLFYHYRSALYPAPNPFSPGSSGYDWSKMRRQYPIAEFEMVRPPRGPPVPLERIQFNFPRPAYTLDVKQHAQREAVKTAFKRCWDAYMEHAFPHDELMPVSLDGKDTFGGWSATMVDALDTLYIMGFTEEFAAALPAVGALDWSDTTLTSVNVFETTIRYLGGLLSAYDLSGEKVILMKAVELGEMLYTAFDTPNHFPPFWFDFSDAKAGRQKAGKSDPSASPCSLSLEFTRLSQLTGEPKYYDAIDRIKRFLESSQNSTRLPGMWPTFIDFQNELADKSSDFTLGAQADSLYEYLPKMSALLGGRDPIYEQMYRSAMTTAEKHMIFRPMLPNGDNVLFIGDVHVRPDGDGVSLQPDGQHLTCFAGGMFGLGGKLFGIREQLATAEKLARGCALAYAAFPTGIMPEIFGLLPCASRDVCEWDEDRWVTEGDTNLPKGFKHARDPRYLLRPEAIESIFLMYRITGKPEYQDIAWRMFLAIQAATSGGDTANSAIKDVTVGPKEITKLDQMESFWLAETLKYFYLIFSPPDVISLDEWVLNTEAHPLKRPDR